MTSSISFGNQDHVLFPVDNLEIAVLGHHRDVAGTQPAVFGYDFAGFLGPLPVALHDLRTADDQFTSLTLR